MSEKLPLLDDLLNKVRRWEIADDNHFYASYTPENGSKMKIPKEYLAEAHPLLPIALVGLIEFARSTNDYAKTFSPNVLATLELLRRPGISCRSLKDREYIIKNVRGLSLAKNCLHISCTWLVTKYTEHNGSQVPFVFSSVLTTLDASKESLDANYPGWETRLTIALDLGLTGSDLELQVFSTNPAENVVAELNGLTYD